MNFRQYFLAAVTGLLVLFSFSCASKLGSSADSEVVFDDNYQKAPKKDEIVIDDSSFGQTSQVSSTPNAHQDPPVQLKDASLLTVMYDGFGNKIEMREFVKDSRLSMMTISTFTNGKQEITVRGRNLERKSLSPEMIDRLKTADADEIARTAGIFETQRATESSTIVLPAQRQQLNPTYQTAQIPPIRPGEPAASNTTSTNVEAQPLTEPTAEKIEPNKTPARQEVKKDSVQSALPKLKQ